MSDDDQVEKWTDIENVKTVYRYMKADRDGWSNLYSKELTTSSRLGIAVLLMLIPTLCSIVQCTMWLFHHIHLVYVK